MQGLTTAEASARLSAIGPNALPERAPDPIWRRFLAQFASPLIYILIFALAFLACLLAPRLGLWTALLGGATVLGVPILDTVTAICRRLAARQHVFTADGEHTHHKLLQAGLSHRGAVLLLYGLGAVFALLGAGILLGETRLFPVAVALALCFCSSATVSTIRPIAIRAAPTTTHGVVSPSTATR